MDELTDVDLLSRLQVALAPLPILPDEECLARLHATLAEITLENEPLDVISAVHRRIAAPVRRRRRSTRSTVLVASAFSFALTAGVAAAAVATNTLPGPTRSIAYALGLPVTSPALFQAQQVANQLHLSITAKDRALEKQSGQKLINAMKTLNSHDLSQIQGTANRLLTEAGLRLPTLGNSITTPLTTPIIVPAAPVPSSKIPGSVPKVTVPGVTIPKVTVPSNPLPSNTVPSVTVPSVTVPSVTVPGINVPSTTIPKVTVPTLKVPGPL